MTNWNAKKISRLSAVASVLILAMMVQGCTRDPNVRKAKYLASGKKYAQQGKEKEAIIQFSNAVKIDPHYAAARFELAKAYLKTGSMLAGYTELRHTVDLDPNNVEARLDLGQIFLASHQPEKAQEQAKAILAINPKDADAYGLLAGVAMSAGDHDTALTDIQQALALDPNRAGFHAELGLIQASNPATAEAGEDQLKKAVELDPKNSSAHLLLAAVLAKKGDTAGAIQQAQAATQADPKNIRAWVTLSGIYYRQGNKQQAEAALAQATDKLHDTEPGANLLLTYYMQTGQVDRASSVYAGLVNKYPKSLPIKMAYARILLAQGNFAKVQDIANQLDKSNGDNPQVQALSGMLLLRSGKVNDAYTLLTKAVKNSPDNAGLKFWLGETDKAKGDLAGAEQNLRDSLRLAPDNVEAQKALATVALENKDYPTLADLSQKLLAKHPDDADGYVWRGLTEAHQNQMDQAGADFETALQKDPKNVTALVELGQLRFNQKRYPEGATLLQQALDANPNSLSALQLLVEYDLFQHQPQKAINLVEQQIGRSPRNSLLYDQLATLQLMQRDVPGALDSSQKAMQINPGDGAAIMAYTRAMVAQGNVAPAMAKWKGWSSAHPNDPRGDVIVGTLAEAQGNVGAATDAYKKALAIQPDQPVAANNLAYLMLQSGQDTDVALSLAETARRAMPHSPNTADTLAWAYYKKGIYGSARDVLEDAEKTDSNDASIEYHLGMIYSKLGQKDNAILHLKKAVSLAPSSQSGADANKALGSL
ncbi:MAG TPA: tetratricopeptide repeat protein [Acidobacteriaceae bacterium]|jgi:tetratricopeptide (TPR) repeat protein|nr:tetratricopeptide repeat protein [Acidobacteriaceae bacterium]